MRLVGGRHLLVAVGFELVEPVRIGALAQGIDHGDLAFPFRLGQFPDVGHRAFIIGFRIVSPDIGVGGDCQRVLELRRDFRNHVTRQVILDKTCRQKLRERRWRIGDQHHVALHIAGLAFTDDHFQLAVGGNLHACRL
ncbi:hypothetical protein D3C87_1208270 [compost metagenome]